MGALAPGLDRAGFGKRAAAVAGISAALVMGAVAEFRSGDFSKFFTWVAAEAAAQYQPIPDRARADASNVDHHYSAQVPVGLPNGDMAAPELEALIGGRLDASGLTESALNEARTRRPLGRVPGRSARPRKRAAL